MRRLAARGAVATLVAMVANAALAALAEAVGVDFAVSNSEETIPVSGIAVVTGFFSVVGIVLAAALARWSADPARRFVWIAGTLTAVSPVPPVLLGDGAATATMLVGLHLVAAAVVVTALAQAVSTDS